MLEILLDGLEHDERGHGRDQSEAAAEVRHRRLVPFREHRKLLDHPSGPGASDDAAGGNRPGRQRDRNPLQFLAAGAVDERHVAASQQLRVDRGAARARRKSVLHVGQGARRGVDAEQRRGRIGQQRGRRGRLDERKIRDDSAGRRRDEPLKPCVANAVRGDHVHREAAEPRQPHTQGVEAVGEQQPRRVGGVRRGRAPQVESRQVGAAVVRQPIEEREELGRLAGARHERPRGLRAITEHDQVDGRVLPGGHRQQGREQGTILPDGVRAAAARGVPGHRRAVRPGAPPAPVRMPARG